MKSSGRQDGRRRVECAGRAQGSYCRAQTFYAEVVETQIGDLLANFVVPKERQDALVEAWRDVQRPTAANGSDRSGIEQKMERLKELYLEGDVDKRTYQFRRQELSDQMSVMPLDEGRNRDAVGTRLATFLADVSLAWSAATSEERNLLARQLLSEVAIENKSAVAVKPRPDLLPYFNHVARCQAPGENNASAEATGFARAPSEPAIEFD
jgi:hypothetical protein